MGLDTRIELLVPRRPDGTLPPEPTVPDGVPREVRDATKLLRDALLLAEHAGLDVAPAAERIDEATSLPDPLPRLFLDEDLELLQEVVDAALRALDGALDEDGGLVAGSSLAAAPFVATDLVPVAFRTSGRTLFERREQLEQLRRLIALARRKGVLLQLV